MCQVIYFITKNNELIYARNFNLDTEVEAQEAVRQTYENIKIRDNIRSIKYTTDKLTFIDTKEGELDEIHTLIIHK